MYGPGTPGPVEVRHTWVPSAAGIPQLARQQFDLILTGNPWNDPRPRGPWVTGPPVQFPRPASIGARVPGGVGTDLFDPATWQRPYAFTPAGGTHP